MRKVEFTNFDLPGVTYQMFTAKEMAAIKESWLAAHGAVPVRVGGEEGSQLQGARNRQEGGDHYKAMGVEPWDVIDTWPVEQRIGFHRGNALKYLMRMGSKDEQLVEVRKARHYIDKLIEILEARDAG